MNFLKPYIAIVLIKLERSHQRKKSDYTSFDGLLQH